MHRDVGALQRVRPATFLNLSMHAYSATAFCLGAGLFLMRLESTGDRCRRALVYATTALCIAVHALAPVLAGPREEARRMHDRLTGVPPSAAVLAQMQADITGGNPINAAMRAMENPAF